MTIDIKSKGVYPSNALSNFYPHSFVIDGVSCGSMEGFLQSLKTKNINEQEKICRLSGKEAKMYFHKKWENYRWKLTGRLYWRGKSIWRMGKGYAALIDRAYNALSNNADFIKALKETEGAVLAHSMGKRFKCTTVLTEKEFIERLNRIRHDL